MYTLISFTLSYFLGLKYSSQSNKYDKDIKSYYNLRIYYDKDITLL